MAIDKCRNISDWDRNEVTDMRFLFNSETDFKDDISDWNVSNVRVGGAPSFNKNLSEWDLNFIEDKP